MTPATRSELVAYLTNTGRLDKAENLVLWAIDEDQPESAVLASTFYERLLRLTDEQLESGGLSREEAADGWATYRPSDSPAREPIQDDHEAE